MPWTANNGPARHTAKAATPKRKRQWAAVANNVLAKTGDEGRAVRAGNAAVKGSFKSETPHARDK